MTPIKLTPDTEKYLLESIKRFFASELEQDIGDLKAMRVLEFCVREVGPSIYNQALSDAQTFVSDKIADLGGVLYEPEFDYWKKK